MKVEEKSKKKKKSKMVMNGWCDLRVAIRQFLNETTRRSSLGSRGSATPTSCRSKTIQ